MKIERRGFIISLALGFVAWLTSLFVESPKKRTWSHDWTTDELDRLGQSKILDRITGAELDKDNRLFIEKLNSETGDFKGMRGEFINDDHLFPSSKKVWALKLNKSRTGLIPFYGSFGGPVDVVFG